jgi:hypothetical protein
MKDQFLANCNCGVHEYCGPECRFLDGWMKKGPRQALTTTVLMRHLPIPARVAGGGSKERGPVLGRVEIDELCGPPAVDP